MSLWKKIVHGILPAFLLAISVGQIYAFTNISSDIATAIGSTQRLVQFAFSLGIFFLGMGAAFFGPIVEKSIKWSAVIGTALFICGFGVLQIGAKIGCLSLVYLGYGVLLGLGTGVIYVTPVKTMMLWFPNHKAVAAALPIIFFGLGSTLSTIVYSFISKFGLATSIWAFMGLYAVMMAVGILLIKKPEGAEKKLQEATPIEFSYKRLLADRHFVHSWLFMFINISAGLCMIPLAKQLMSSEKVRYTAELAAVFVAASGVFNGGGRFLFAWISDKLAKRLNIVFIIAVLSMISILMVIANPILIGPAILIINACYGAGFSIIPAVLSDKFGMKDISKIHGAVLSAWGIAGLFGNQIALVTEAKFGFIGVFTMIFGLYFIELVNFLFWRKA